MGEMRTIAAFLGMQVRGWSIWLACMVAVALEPLARMAAAALGPWVASEAAPVDSRAGSLFGLYLGLTCIARGRFLVARSSRGARVGFQFTVVGLHVGCVTAAAGLATIGSAPLASTVSAWAWSTVLLAALAAGLGPYLRGPGRCFVAAVALAWWIPAVLPPSFLGAVPRALRHLVVGGAEFAAPSTPAAWLADTALVAGLLLLAWAPRRATPRGDEVRHPG